MLPIRFSHPLVLAALLLVASSPVPAATAGLSHTDELIAQSARRLDRRPMDRQALLSLSDGLARKGRETGDAAYFSQAADLLRTATQTYTADARLWRHLAYVLSLQHDFPAALEAGRRAVELDPNDAGCRGVLGDALLELGRYDEAESLYRQMNELVPDLASLSRLSGMASLRGQNAQAIGLLRRAIAAGRAAAEPSESIAWAQWQMGVELYQTGELSRATTAFRAALSTHPGYFRAHAGLAMVAAARGRYAAAERAYGLAMAAVPMPEYAVGLAQIYLAQGRAQDAQAQLALVAQLTRLGGGRFQRDVAYFYLERGEHTEHILAQSEQDLRQRQDLPGYQLHAWALFKNGRFAEARTSIAHALSLGTRDARLFYQAGMIHRANGDQSQARSYLRRALQLNPAFHPHHAAQARAILAGRDA